MYDFVSAGTLNSIDLPEDALGHDLLARAIILKATQLPPGSVIAIQGSWGRGKTDVVARVARAVREPGKYNLPATIACESLWINPWQYGTPDLLTPLVIALLEQIPPEAKSGKRSLRKAAESIIRAGFNFGLKTAALAIPGAPLLAAAENAVDSLLGGLFEALDRETGTERPDLDPVAAMGNRFKELVDALIPEQRMRAGARLLVCVDDIDRCLPDRQVALLEAIRFLISSGAPATFLIAIDPTLVRQAIVTHYKTEAFDPDRYLDKMFDLRVNMTAMGSRVEDLLDHHFGRTIKHHNGSQAIAGLVSFAIGSNDTNLVRTQATRALSRSGLSNPRVIRRVIDKIHLFACAESSVALGLKDADDIRMFFLWLGLCERWPNVRHAIQDGGADGFVNRLRHLIVLHRRSDRQTNPLGVSAIDELPQPGKSLDFTELMKELIPEKAELLRNVDTALVSAGM